MFDVWLTCALSMRLSHAGALIRSELPAKAEKSATVSACQKISRMSEHGQQLLQANGGQTRLKTLPNLLSCSTMCVKSCHSNPLIKPVE